MKQEQGSTSSPPYGTPPYQSPCGEEASPLDCSTAPHSSPGLAQPQASILETALAGAGLSPGLVRAPAPLHMSTPGPSYTPTPLSSPPLHLLESPTPPKASRVSPARAAGRTVQKIIVKVGGVMICLQVQQGAKLLINVEE